MRKLLLGLIMLILQVYLVPSGAIAATAADTQAQAQYLRGSGLLQAGEYAAAAVCLSQAAAQEDAEAMYHLGVLSFELAEPDYNAVADLWRRAAELGFEPAAYNLGLFYFHGYGSAPDYALTVSWLEKAHDLGSATAAYNLGLLYLHDLEGVKDSARALTWLESAAARGNDDAKYMLGRLYYNGESWPRDFVKARAYLEAVADYENPEGMYCLGVLYGRGLGGDAALDRALECYESAAAQSYAPAQFELGNLYYEGAGGKQKDLVQAYMWLSLAADEGLPEAQERVIMLTRELELNQMGQGQIALARAYYFGQGGRQDAVKVYSHLLIAQEYDQNVEEMLGTLRGLTDAERLRGEQMAQAWLQTWGVSQP